MDAQKSRGSKASWLAGGTEVYRCRGESNWQQKVGEKERPRGRGFFEKFAQTCLAFLNFKANKQTNTQTNKHTHKQTNTQTQNWVTFTQGKGAAQFQPEKNKETNRSEKEREI